MFINLAVDCVRHGGAVGWFAPTYKILDDAWYRLRDALAPYTVAKNESKYRIDLRNGGYIECWSLNNNADAGRSRAYNRVIIDEAALIPHLETAWNQAIRPTLTDMRGDAWFGSTPRGPGYYKALHDRGQDAIGYDDWVSWQIPTTENPYINGDELLSVREELPELVYAQEYEAQFNLTEGAVFRNIEHLCVYDTVMEPVPNHPYSVGIDWGKTHDFTAISVFDLLDKREVYLDRFNKLDYLFQVERLATVVENYKPVVIVPELNSMGQVISEILTRMYGDKVVPFPTSNPTKRFVIEGMSLMMDKQRVGFVHDPVATAELQAYESKILPSGNIQYSAPKGQHDDTVMARALALSPAIEAPRKEVAPVYHYYDPVSIGPNI